MPPAWIIQRVKGNVQCHLSYSRLFRQFLKIIYLLTTIPVINFCLLGYVDVCANYIFFSDFVSYSSKSVKSPRHTSQEGNSEGWEISTKVYGEPVPVSNETIVKGLQITRFFKDIFPEFCQKEPVRTGYLTLNLSHLHHIHFYIIWFRFMHFSSFFL